MSSKAERNKLHSLAKIAARQRTARYRLATGELQSNRYTLEFPNDEMAQWWIYCTPERVLALLDHIDQVDDAMQDVEAGLAHISDSMEVADLAAARNVARHYRKIAHRALEDE